MRTPGAALAPPHLQDDDQKEVEVRYAVELLIQVQGQEGEDIVLGRVDDVVLERERGVGGQGVAQARGLLTTPPRQALSCPPATTSCN